MTLFYRIVQLMSKIPALQNIRLLFYFYDSVVLRFIRRPVRQAGKKKVLVVFPLSLGDAVMFYGSVPYLYEIYPKDTYEVTVTCHDAYAELFQTQFEHVLPVDYRKASISPGYRIRFLKRIREQYYDTAIDPIGAEECGPNVYAMNAVCADRRIGVLTAQDKAYQCPEWLRRRAYDRILEKKEKNVHKIRYYAETWSELAGVRFEPKVASLPVGNHPGLPEKYAVVYPSASIPVKRWPVERYASVTKRIQQETGYTIVCCGTEADREITDTFIALLDGIRVVNMLGQTSVLQLIEIIGHAELVLTNDTSIYHIAVATGRKTCVVSGGYVYDTFLDYIHNGYGHGIEGRVRIAAHRGACMNCYNDCRYPVDTVYPCVEEVAEEEVWDLVKGMVAR